MKPTESAAKSLIIAIVDDDASMRTSMRRLIGLLGFRAEAFGSAREFLDLGCLAETACLILDVRMPGMDGLELQGLLANANYRIPMIFVTAHASDDEQRRATQARAVAFLRKPVSDQALISTIQAALQRRRQDEHGQMYAARR